MAKKIEVDLEEMRRQLAQDLQPDPKQKLSLRQIVFELMPVIQQKLNEGCTVDDLVVWFADKGFTFTNRLLRSYIWQYQNQKPQPEAAAAVAPAAGAGRTGPAPAATGPAVRAVGAAAAGSAPGFVPPIDTAKL